MNSTEFNREILSFDEKIALSEMEEAKALQRTKELQYSKARYRLDVFLLKAKESQDQPVAPQPKEPG